jgi:peptidoglycan/LPS O-acetylase OafA/YrhL
MTNDVQEAGASKSALRTDIQALRGFAVLVVLLYHAAVPGLPGGYLGVDVFFVISGFLITGLIRKGIERGDFRFRDFYFRRAKRLLPPSFVVLALTVLAAPLFISDVVFKDFIAQVWGALTFSTNHVLWAQSGYFDTTAETKPLLHFWSLAVEEQYYLVMPALLVFIPRRLWLPIVAVQTAASGVLCVVMLRSDPTGAFFFAPSRAWELGIGSIGALLPAALTGRRWLSLLRVPALLALIGIPLFPIGTTDPGLDAIVVCVATLLVILGHKGNRAERSFPVRSLAFVGNFSYSLYLIHWPLLVFARSSWLEAAPDWFLWITAALAIPLAWLLYRFVEEPFRRGFYNVPFRTVGAIVLAAILIAVSPVAVSFARATGVDFDHLRRNNYGMARECTMGKFVWSGEVAPACRTTENPKFLIIGDSYGMAWSSALMKPLAEDGFSQVTFSACDPLLDMGRFPKRDNGGSYNRDYARGCMAFYRQMVAYTAHAPGLETVIIAGRLSTILSDANKMLVAEPGKPEREEATSVELAAKGMEALVLAIRSSGKQVVILEPPPADGTDIGECLERTQRGMIVLGRPFGCDIRVPDYRSYRARTKALLALVHKNTGAPVVGINDFLCDKVKCVTRIDGVALYRDSGHLAVEGAVRLGKVSPLAERVRAAADQPAVP